MIDYSPFWKTLENSTENWFGSAVGVVSDKGVKWNRTETE